MAFPSTIDAPKAAFELPRELLFDVTDEDICLGVKSKPNECMISRAVRRTIFLESGVQVAVWTGFNGFKVFYELGSREYLHEYAKTVQKFDAGYDVAPFTGVATQIRA